MVNRKFARHLVWLRLSRYRRTNRINRYQRIADTMVQLRAFEAFGLILCVA